MKPYSIQAPEEIAKEYAGDKQKIMNAAQMGILDPTAAVLAGMFIDRMRAPQGGPPQTVAQETFNPAPPPPPAGAPPMGAPPMGGPPPMEGGMAPPQMPMGAPPMEGPPMEAPPMPMMAEGGMLAPPYTQGGLDGIPVPDTMFDENRNGGFNDGYAGGGIIAFAEGGPLGSWYEEQAKQVIPGVRVTSGLRTKEHNARVGGAPNSYHLTDNARDFVPPPGVTMAQLQAQLRGKYGAGHDIINEGDHVHVEPGKRAGKSSKKATPTAATSAPEGRVSPLEDFSAQLGPLTEENLKLYDKWAPQDNKRRDALTKQIEDDNTPEAKEKARKADMWQTLSEIGFGMASTKSPNFLQAVGDAAMAALPGARADRKARDAKARESLKALADIEGMSNEEARDKVKTAVGMASTALGLKEQAADRTAQRSNLITELGVRERMQSADHAARLAAAEIAAGSKGAEQAVDDVFARLKQQVEYGQDIFLPGVNEQGKRVKLKGFDSKGQPSGQITDEYLRDLARQYVKYYDKVKPPGAATGTAGPVLPQPLAQPGAAQGGASADPLNLLG